MNRSQSPYVLNNLSWGAIQIAGLYLLIGGLWILFSDQVAARIASSEEVLATISLYKGWGYVVATALLLYWLIQRHTTVSRASEAQLQRVIDAMPAFIAYVGADRHYRFTNKTYQEWYDEKTEGKHIEEVLGQAAYRRVANYIDKVLSGETVSYETEIPYQDTELFMSITYTPDITADGQVKGFFVLAQDRTEQKQAKEERQLWADAFEGCAHGIAIGDPHTNRILACNPAFASMHKRRTEDIVGSSILSLYASSDHGHLRRNIEKADQIGHASFEAHMIRKDNSTFPVQMDIVSILGDGGELLYRVATAQDISERKSIDEKLKASETKYRTLVEHLPAITYISQPDQYMGVSYISPQIEALGFNTNTWLADPEFWFRQIHPEDQERVSAELERFQGDGESFKVEYRLRLPNGETRWFHDESIRVKDQDGKPIFKQGFMQDITERKQAEENLRRFELLSEHSRDIILFMDRKDGRILESNAAAVQTYGYNHDELLMLTIWDLRASNTHELTADQMAQADAKGILFETVHQRKDGTTFPVEVSSQGAVIGGVRTLISIVRDITKRKQAETALLESSIQFRTLFEASPDAILLIDPRGNWPILDCNTAACQMNGYARDELIGQPIDILNAQPLSSVVLDEYLANIRQAGVLRYETSHRRKDGTEFPIEVSTSLISLGGRDVLLGIDRDITERKQAEEKVRKSEERYHYLFENNPHPMWIYDRETLAFLDVNEAAIAKYGYSRQEFLNMTLVDIRPPEDVKQLMNNLAQPRQPLEHSEGWRHRLKDGTIIHVEITSHTIEIDGHESALVVAQDVSERVQAQNTIRLKDELLRMTSEMAKVGGWEFDTQTLTGTWTDEVARIHGLEPSEETNVEMGLRFYVGESREKINQAVKDAVELGKPYDLELEMVSARGNHKWVRTVALPTVSDGKVVKVQGIFQDITERKQAEIALRESEQKFSVIYYKAPFAAALSRFPDGVIVDVNEAFERVFGYTRQEVTGKTSLELGINPDSEGRARMAAELQARGSVREAELTLHTKSGITRVFLMNIDLVGIGGQKYIFQTAQDITERKQIEKALQEAHDELELKVQERTAALSEANALLQALMDNMPDHIYFKDRQGRFIRNSKSQANLLGLSDPEQAIGKTDFDFFPHAARSYAEEQEVMRSGKSLVDLEEWVVWPDGRETWVLTTKLPLRNSDGQTIGIFGISHDITERKQAEQAIRQLNIDLEKQAEKLQVANKELEAFSYSVSHDLRAPLRAIDGYTRILVEDYEPILDEEGKRMCGIISKEARRMGQLIDDLLAFSRLGRKEMHVSKIDMKALAVSTFDELTKEEKPERIDFQVRKLPPIKGDSALIRQVWVNLLSNALKFTSKKAQVVIEVGSQQSKDENIYYVRDSGAGFDMEYANKLFGVFQRLHGESEFEGTGVGLAIVQRIIRRHGGRVWAKGEVDKGATFYFSLPRKETQHE